MSTDFTGNNDRITSESLMRMSSDTIGRILNISRESIFDLYVSLGKCSNSNNGWTFYDRYARCNDYTGNKLDDLIVLRECVENNSNRRFDDKDPSSSTARRTTLKTLLSNEISDKKCNDIASTLDTSMIPHLDIPKSISILKSREDSVCEESGVWEILTPEIDYTDSCGCDTAALVPQYPANYSGPMNSIRGDSIYVNGSFQWYVDREDQIKISSATSSKKESTLEISTLSSAIIDEVNVEVEYSE